MRLVKLKDGRIGCVEIEPRPFTYGSQTYQQLAKVILQDGTFVMVGNDDLEDIINDRTNETNKSNK